MHLLGRGEGGESDLLGEMAVRRGTKLRAERVND
jgi:hypothetical protein